MPLEIRGAHFLIRSAQLVRGTRLEYALGPCVCVCVCVCGTVCQYIENSAACKRDGMPVSNRY